MTKKQRAQLKALNNQINSLMLKYSNNEDANAKLSETIAEKLKQAQELRRRPTLPDFCPAAANGTQIKEIHYNPTRYDEDGNGIEPCEPREADQHSVYIRDTEGLLHNIADFATKNDADNFQRLIENIVRTLKTAPPKDNGFNHSQLEQDATQEFSNYSNLAYSLERDEENNIWELSIISTSSSELDGSEEGELESYSYPEAMEAIEDIQTMKARYGIYFDEL